MRNKTDNFEEFENKKYNLKKEFENFKEEMFGYINKINDWSIMIEKRIFAVAGAVDKQDKHLLDLIYKMDTKLRQDIIADLNILEKKYNFTSYNSSFQASRLVSKVNNLDEEVSKIKNFSDIRLIFHNSLFQELEQFINLKLNKNDMDIKEVDHYLSEKFSIKRDKTRKIKGRDTLLTLPVYIRHYFNHRNDEVNEKPTSDEIDCSIKIMMDVIQKLKK